MLTLRDSTAPGGFDDSELHRLACEHDLIELREHVLSVAAEPCLAMVATGQQTEESTVAPPAEQVTDQISEAECVQFEDFEALAFAIRQSRPSMRRAGSHEGRPRSPNMETINVLAIPLYLLLVYAGLGAGAFVYVEDDRWS
ncbi:MAG: hypothetical protein ACO4CT_13780 [Planctomycetota bacterium]